MTVAKTFDVFLSHNSKDKPAVERLAQKLRREGLEPWLDKWALTPGGQWQNELATGIQVSSACAVFVGPHGLGAWENEELGLALDRAAKDRSFRLFLVLLPGLPEPFDANTLPPFLSTRTWIDLRSGIENTRPFQLLINAIKGVAPGPDAPVEKRDDICPYRGLRTFDEEHAEFFFGRDADVQRLVEKLKASRFLAVIGASGSGKSSVVRAGLIPALRHGRAARKPNVGDTRAHAGRAPADFIGRATAQALSTRRHAEDARSDDGRRAQPASGRVACDGRAPRNRARCVGDRSV